MGAVKDRRIPGGGAALSGVLGADASAIVDMSGRRIQDIAELQSGTHLVGLSLREGIC